MNGEWTKLSSPYNSFDIEITNNGMIYNQDAMTGNMMTNCANGIVEALKGNKASTTQTFFSNEYAKTILGW